MIKKHMSLIPNTVNGYFLFSETNYKMSFRETSTMISDFVLSATCFLAGTGRMSKLREFSWREFAISWFGMIGFSVFGFAAFLGVLRFGYLFPRRHYSLKDYHRYFSDLASMLG